MTSTPDGLMTTVPLVGRAFFDISMKGGLKLDRFEIMTADGETMIATYMPDEDGAITPRE